MPASGKILANKQKRENRENGIGDADGRLPSRVKAAEVSSNCTICMTAIRMTKKNVEAKTHCDSRHPTSTFAVCFPGFTCESGGAAAGGAVVGGAESAAAKADIDFIKKQAREAKTLAEGGMTEIQKAEMKKSTKKKEDLSFLDASVPSKKK